MSVELLPRFEEYAELLASRLPEKKIQHCLSVARYLSSFVDDIGVGKKKAMTAGLLHDICRKCKDEKLLTKAGKYGIPISAIARSKPSLLHGPVAAEECRRLLGLKDGKLYEAIYYHTTAKPELCRLGQALYFADFSEPLRSHPEAAKARALLKKKGFDHALGYVARKKVLFLKQKKITDPITESFQAWVERELLA